MPRIFLSLASVASLAALLILSSAVPASAQVFSRADYVDVTSRKKLPKPTKAGPLAAVAQYLATMAYLDPKRIAVEVLADEDNRRVYRIELICKSAEECGDDSVARTREAVEVTRGTDGGWAVIWTGAQFTCHQGRGHTDWSKVLCI